MPLALAGASTRAPLRATATVKTRLLGARQRERRPLQLHICLDLGDEGVDALELRVQQPDEARDALRGGAVQLAQRRHNERASSPAGDGGEE